MQSLGERRVRVSFNPAQHSDVDEIKYATAELIDRIGSLETDNPEQLRLIALAQTAYEEASMWAVKAVTMDSK